MHPVVRAILQSGATLDEYVKLLLHCNGTNGSVTFTDERGKAATAFGNAQISTAQYKFGNASGLFDGTGDYVELADSDDWAMGSGDFTIDFWFKRSGTGTTQRMLGQSDSTAATNSTSFLVGFTSANLITFDVYSGSTQYRASATTITDSNWHHAAAVREGNTLKLYVDGNVGGVTANVTGVTINNSSNKLSVGRMGEYNGFYFNGYLDELRISKGIARWTSNFTPPTEEYAA